jgi:hypothetical protein
MIDKNYNDPIHHYQNILELRGHQHSIYNRKVERLAEVRNRPNPMSILERFIGKVNNSSELEEKMRQWDRLQRKNGIAYF